MTSAGDRSVWPYRLPVFFASGDTGFGRLRLWWPSLERIQFAVRSSSSTSANRWSVRDQPSVP